MKHLMKNRRMITVIMALILLLNYNTFSRAIQIEPHVEQGLNENKIEEEVRKAMNSAGENELIPICLWRKDIDTTEFNSLLQERSGYDPAVYEDVLLFKEQVLPIIEDEVRAQHRSTVGPIKNAINVLLPEDESEWDEAEQIKKATRDRINDYIHQKRVVAREENTKRNRTFIANTLSKRDDRKVYFCSKYTSTIFVDATKSEIEMLANDETVESISIHVEYECEPTLSDVLSQVGVYCEGGTGYEHPGIWPALSGSNIKIGVLEAPEISGYGGAFNNMAPQLYGKTNLHFINNYRESGGIVPFPIVYMHQR